MVVRCPQLHHPSFQNHAITECQESIQVRSDRPKSIDGKTRNEQVEFVDDESVDLEVKTSRVEKQSLEKEVSSCLKHQLFNSGGIVSLDQLLEAEGKLKDITEENKILENICREKKKEWRRNTL